MCCFWAERLNFNTKCKVCSFGCQEKIERCSIEGLEIGHLRRNLTSGHNTCETLIVRCCYTEGVLVHLALVHLALVHQGLCAPGPWCT